MLYNVSAVNCTDLAWECWLMAWSKGWIPPQVLPFTNSMKALGENVCPKLTLGPHCADIFFPDYHAHSSAPLMKESASHTHNYRHKYQYHSEPFHVKMVLRLLMMYGVIMAARVCACVCVCVCVCVCARACLRVRVCRLTRSSRPKSNWRSVSSPPGKTHRWSRLSPEHNVP